MGSGLIATFNDVAKDHWAAPYIEYCVSQGIVGGVGGGNFNPTGNITGTQAAKMLLCILGYNASIQGYVGSDYWETNINVDAAQKGLYAGLTNLDASAPLTRDQAAQMIWNALNAYEVEYKTTLVAGPDGTLTSKVTVQDKLGIDSKNKITLLEDKYEADTAIGIFAGNHKTNKGSIKDGNIQITSAKINGETPSVGGGATPQFKYDLDLKYIGEEIKVLYRDNKDGTNGNVDEKDTIYGVYITGATEVINVTKGDIDNLKTTEQKIKINGTKYDVADTVTVNTNYGASTSSYASSQLTGTSSANSDLTTALKASNGDTIKFIKNSSGKIESAYIVTSVLAKVNSVNADKVSLSGIGSISIADNNVYSGIAKDDVVAVTTYYAAPATNDDAYSVVTKAETVSGKLSGFKGTENVSVNGTTYDIKDETLQANLTDDYKTSFANSDVDKDVTLYLVNGYVSAVDVPASSANYALVTEANTSTGAAGSLSEFKMKVMLADGTKQTVTVDEDSAVTTLGSSNIPEGSIVKYASINSSNVMDLTAVSVKYDTGMTVAGGDTPVYNKDTKEFNGVMTDSTGVLFAKVGSKYYSYNIRSLNNITVANAAKYGSVTNSDGKVIAAYVELGAKPSGSTTDTIYGIVSADKGVVKVGDDYQKAYVVSNNNGDYDVYMGASSTKLEKGDIVYFDKSADNVYNDADVTKVTAGIYVKELDKGNVLSYFTSVTDAGSNGFVGNGLQNVALDSDAQIVYVNQDGDKAGSDIGVNGFDKITGYANAAIVVSNGKIDAIIVESSNECDILSASKATQDKPGSADVAETITITVTNTGIAAVTGADLKNADGTAVDSAVATATASVTTGTVTINVTEQTGKTLPAGTYTAEVKNNTDVVATYTFTIAA